MYIDYSYNGKLKGERVSRDLFYCFKIIASGYGEGTAKKSKQGDQLGSCVNNLGKRDYVLD